MFAPQVANAQLEALRLENRHLRRTTLTSQRMSNDVDLDEAERHLKELQGAYTASIRTLEVTVPSWSGRQRAKKKVESASILIDIVFFFHKCVLSESDIEYSWCYK